MSDSTLQFETAEYPGSAPSCAFCHRPISGPHYLLDARAVCPTCREALLHHTRSASAPELAKGALFGLGAAVAGGAAWYAVSAGIGLELGILAIGVGWLVAWAVRSGSGGGGLPQQILAVSLTYLAIVGTYVPGIAAETDLVSAIVAALAVPILMVISWNASNILWFIIVGIALWGAWRRTAGVHLVLTGPFG